MSEQPEAIRLAAVCDLGHPLEDDVALIGPELLRLHAVESGAKVELMRRDNLIDSLHGLCESYRTQVESLTRELYQATNPPFSGKTDSWQAACGKARTERDEARTQVESLQVEVNEQARLNGMGAERELALMAKVEILQAASVEWSPAYTRGPARQSAPVTAVPALVPLIARQLGEWHEDDGYAVWWAWNGETRGWAGEPAYIGSPLCDNWPGYHTHWTLHPKQPECIGLTVGDGAQPIKDAP